MPFTHLISVAALQAHLNHPDWVVVDCRFSLADTEAGRRAYRSGHIPGAWYAHLDEDLSGPIVKGKTGRHPLPDPAFVQGRFSDWGIGAHTQVVAYDDLGGAMAARLWWLLRWLGHEAVAVLNGGFQAWVSEHGECSTALPSTREGGFAPHLNPDMARDSRFIEQHLQDPTFLLVDSRAPERYRGDVEPIDPVAGHIPGAVNLFHATNIGPDGLFLPEAALRQKFEALLQGHEAEKTVFYCGSGVTAAHNLLAMEVAGIKGASLYPGSWSEWIADPSRPVARGETKY
jgi:thiosulfate/3-mercaptopyruvate sulfurtransferase